MSTAPAHETLGRPVNATGRPRGRSSPLGSRLSGLPWILPAIVLVIGLIYFPIGYLGYASTLNWNGFILSTPTSIGDANYAKMFGDPVFWNALWHTVFFYVITFSVQTFIGFTFAAVMHSRIRLGNLYKAIVFVPVVLAPATMAPVFRQIFDQFGQFNWLLSSIGLGSLTRPWLADPTTAMPVIMFITVWEWTGLTFVLYYAAMSQLSPEILEAARVDGAGNFRTLRSIVWPMCRGTTAALAVLGLIGALKTFDIPYLVTHGGPNHGTEFLGTYIYYTMAQGKHFGYAATLAIALLVLAVAGGVLLRISTSRSDKE
jgi:raffinose/stachyose/melibiose transport system permease protein